MIYPDFTVMNCVYFLKGKAKPKYKRKQEMKSLKGKKNKKSKQTKVIRVSYKNKTDIMADKSTLKLGNLFQNCKEISISVSYTMEVVLVNK